MNHKLPVLTVALVLTIAAGARADGLPLPVDESESGVLTEDGDIRFLTASARGRTAVIAQDARLGAVIAADVLKGRLTVPLVSYDGTAGGLSGDERTLALIRPRARFPRRTTTFAVFRVDLRRQRLRLQRTVRLRGDFSFDALSEDGRSLFLINYISPRNPRRYRVRVYDLRRGRLAPKPIVDPREDPDEMNGYPVARATSLDDRWAYTLYEGKDHPFIHALDMKRRKAVCIDLDDLHGDPYQLRLAVEDAKTLAVWRGGRKIRTVDTGTFDVRRPEADAPAAEERTQSVLAPLPTGALALLLAVAAVLKLRGRAR